MQTFHGTWPALVTPATPEGGVNVQVLRDLTEHLVGKQVDGFYLCGSTGEGLYCSPEERQLVAETVIDQVAGRVPIIVQTFASHCTSDNCLVNSGYLSCPQSRLYCLFFLSTIGDIQTF